MVPPCCNEMPACFSSARLLTFALHMPSNQLPVPSQNPPKGHCEPIFQMMGLRLRFPWSPRQMASSRARLFSGPAGSSTVCWYTSPALTFGSRVLPPQAAVWWGLQCDHMPPHTPTTAGLLSQSSGEVRPGATCFLKEQSQKWDGNALSTDCRRWGWVSWELLGEQLGTF